MYTILLGLIINLPVPGGQDSSCVIKAVHAMLDFLYLAQFQSHTSDSLNRMEASLATFHEYKAVFIDLSAWEHFNFLKLHSLLHYTASIHLFGTTDTTIQSNLSAFILTSQKMPIMQQIARMSTPK